MTVKSISLLYLTMTPTTFISTAIKKSAKTSELVDIDDDAEFEKVVAEFDKIMEA